MMHRPRLRVPSAVRLFVVVVACLLLAVGPSGFAAAQSNDRSAVWERYDVDLTVSKDGKVHVKETQVVRFDGRFSTGFATIPTTQVESLDNVKVSIAEGKNGTLEPAEKSFKASQPGTYSVDQNSADINIDYAFNPTSAFGNGDANMRTIVLEYDLTGAIRVYDNVTPKNQQLRWVAIASDVTEIAPIRESKVTLTLPEKVDAAQTVARPELASNDGQTFTWTKSKMRSGDAFEVNFQFPPVTTATMPSWQTRSDNLRKQAQEQEKKSALAGTMFMGSGIFMVVAGSLALAGLWYARGRDPQTGVVADILPEPPDDLRPGAVGTLLDETTHPRDVIAAVFDLAERGVLRLDETESEGFFGFGKQKQFSLTLLDPNADLKGYEKTLLNSIFGPGATAEASVPLANVNQTFQSHASSIYSGFYDELVEAGYFDSSPDSTRKRSTLLAFVGPVIALLVIFGISRVTGASSVWMVVPIIAGVILMLIGSAVAKNMPRKTLKGAEAAAKWRAFKRYLEDIEHQSNLEEAQSIFQKYLPYATAFGLQNDWINKFRNANAQMPAWFGGPAYGGGFGNYPHHRPGGGVWVFPGGMSGGSTGGPQSGSDSGGGFQLPGMQDASDSSHRTLQAGSDSIFDMIGTASSIFGGSDDHDGGSWGSFGGGGGGGFSGGGGFGGGGGGGSRGFGD